VDDTVVATVDAADVDLLLPSAVAGDAWVVV
jgi:hypothetical protein